MSDDEKDLLIHEQEREISDLKTMISRIKHDLTEMLGLVCSQGEEKPK